MDGGTLSFIATSGRGIEPILEEELRAMGAQGLRPTGGGVHFAGDLAVGLRACLWSRTASRVLLILGDYPADRVEAIYAAVHAIAWEDHFDSGGTIAVDFSGRGAGIENTMFGAQLVKDAVVDRFRERCGTRPSVDLDRPDCRINCHISREGLSVRIDLAGGSLHQRGYRLAARVAPLKENLAAALLLKAGWPGIAAAGGAFLDPLCGAGTLVIEAALAAADAAPGLSRPHWGFTGWRGGDPGLWRGLLDEALERRAAGMTRAPRCTGFDADPRAVVIAAENAERAGMTTLVHFERRLLEAARPGAKLKSGLVLTNPPYGKRLGEDDDLGALYAQLGDVLKERFQGWQVAVFTGEPTLGKRMGLRAHKVNAFYNGPLPCQLIQIRVDPDRFVDRDGIDERQARAKIDQALAGGADAFLNRLKKNLRTVGRWAAREGISCYRLYDADLPEYAVAVDRYGDWVHVQEYAPPATIDAERAAERLRNAMTLVPHALGIAEERVVLKVRERQRGKRQYEKQDERGQFIEVNEGPCRFLVNLTDYLDTGLFLDHRQTRALLGGMAAGKRFLNLFCYTGTATVYAALGGATATTSVDLSPTYLDWARRNMEHNGCTGRQHQFIQADCTAWIDACRERFDLVFLDPPTFSNSKRMTDILDVQRDHPRLIMGAMRLLSPGGALVFSTNRQRFSLDGEALAGLSIEDITKKTIPKDFERNQRIHHCWLLRAGTGAGAGEHVAPGGRPR